MLKDTSKVHELFRGMDEILERKKDFDTYAAILRELISKHVVSGKWILSKFFEKDTASTWLQYVATHYGMEHACEFYSILLDIPKEFFVTIVKDFVKQDEKVIVNVKQKWMDLMIPLAKELTTEDVPADVLVKVMWMFFEQKDDSMKSFYSIGQTLFTKLGSKLS